MANANYRTIPALLKKREAFTGNTMRAEWVPANSADIDTGRLMPGDFDEAALRQLEEWSARTGLPIYVVYSYSTPIAFGIGDDGPAYVVSQRFSVTTSRQQNLCRAYFLSDHDRAASEVVAA
jgi:hypothetical protein